MKLILTHLYLFRGLRPFKNYGRFLGAFLFFCVGTTHLATAQKVLWDKTIGGGFDDWLTSVHQTTDGGYILGGSSQSVKSGDKSEDARPGNNIISFDYWVVKLKADGTKAWDKTLGSRGEDHLTSVRQTRDGGYILSGTSRSGKGNDKSEANKGNNDYWIVKLNADGSKAWDKTIGGKGEDNCITAQQTLDGGYLIGGTSNSAISGDKSQAPQGKNDIWIVKLKADGTKAWDKTIGGDNLDYLNTLHQLPDGNILLGSTSSSGISGVKSEASKGEEDYWLIKLNAQGTKIWDKTIGSNSGDKLRSFNLTHDGGYILGGSSGSGVSGDKSEAKSGIWLVKLQADGTKLWDKTLTSGDSDLISSVFQTTDHGYIVGSHSYLGKSDDKSEASKGESDFWLVKLTENGEYVADKSIGGNSYEWLSTVQLTTNGQLLVGGTSYSNQSEDKSQNSKGSADYWLVKLENEFKKNQTITFKAITNKELGDPAFSLSAIASSGLPITYQVLAGPATISGNKLTVTGPGNVRVAAIQPGNQQYNQTKTSQSFLVTLTGKQGQKSYGSSKGDTLTAMLATPDGGYLLGGTSASHSSPTGDKSQSGQGSTDYWVVKVDAAGTKVWDKTFGGREAEQLTTLVTTPDGGYLLGGSSASGVSGNKTQPGQGSNDYWLVKIDSVGNLLWNKSYGGAAEDKLSTLLTTTNGYLLGGSSSSGISGAKTQASKGKIDYWVLKIDTNGNQVWDKTYGGSNNDYLTALISSPHGGYLVGGTSSSGATGDKTQRARAFTDYWVLYVNEQGTKVWDNTYGGITGYVNADSGPYETGHSFLSSLVATPDGGYLLGGSSSAFLGAEKSEDTHSGAFEFADYWLIKINRYGVKQWDKTYGGLYTSVDVDFTHGTGNSELHSILTLPEGGYLLAGTSDSYKGGEKTEENRRENKSSDRRNESFEVQYALWNDYWLVKIDEQGNKLEDRTIGGRENDQLLAVARTKDGNFLLAGYSESEIGADKSTPKIGDTDYWLVQITANKLESPNWDTSYGGVHREQLSDVILTSDGGYLSGGLIGAGFPDYFVVKSDKNGNMLWSKSYGGFGRDYLNRVIQTQDGGYLLAGSSTSGQELSKSQPSRGDRDYWIVKIDAQGNKQWDKSFGGSGADNLRKVVQLASGEYLLGGFSNSPASGDKSQGSRGGNDYWVVKISSTGAKIWDKRYGGSADETLGSFTITKEGGIFLGGTSFSPVSGDKTSSSQGSSDYWLVKTDQNGQLLWDKTYGGNGHDEVYSVGRSHGENLFVAGTSNSGKNGDKSQASPGDQDYWLIKLDKNGTKIWDKTFGGSKADQLQASTYTNDGGYLLGGTSGSGLSGDKTQASRGANDYWIVKLDPNGSKQWDKRFGGDREEDLRTVFQTSDGGYLLGGSSNSGISGDRSQPIQDFYIQDGYSSDFWLVKIAPEATSTTAIRATDSPELTNSPAGVTSVTAYPNPARDKVTFRFTLPQTETATLKVYDSQGREITTLFQEEAQKNQTYWVEWPADKQPAGLYFLQLQTPTQKQQQKLILTK